MFEPLQHQLLLALSASGRQLLLFVAPFFLFALAMQAVSHLIRNYCGALLGNRLYVWLTAPGVIVHELGHASFCLVFGHRIVAISLFNPRGDGTLGYVKHSYNRRSLYQNLGNFFIGSGPLWFGSAMVVLLTQVLLEPALLSPLARLVPPTGGGWSWERLLSLLAALPQPLAELAHALFPRLLHGDWQLILFVYLAFSIGSHVTLSPADLRGTLPGLLLLLAGILFFNLLLIMLSVSGESLLVPLYALISPVLVVLALILLLNLLFLLATVTAAGIVGLIRG